MFCGLEKDSTRKVIEWALTKQVLAEVLVQAVISLYEGLRKKSELDQGQQTNLGYGLVCIKDLCYRH